jgi:hypothetical protein
MTVFNPNLRANSCNCFFSFGKLATLRETGDFALAGERPREGDFALESRDKRASNTALLPLTGNPFFDI